MTREAPTSLQRGSHADPEEGVCLMEAVAYVAGEPHTDHPKCCSPVIAAFARRWNDDMRTDEERAQLLPHIPKLIGTANGTNRERRRGEMALDWLLREHAPAWLDLAGLGEHAMALRSMDRWHQPTIDAAWAAAWAAAGAAAGAAAWDAARDAAWDAAWDAAGAAAWAAAWAAAGAAAGAAARDAASDAAGAAAWAAAGAAAQDALGPTVQALQRSAHQLLDRMIAA